MALLFEVVLLWTLFPSYQMQEYGKRELAFYTK